VLGRLSFYGTSGELHDLVGVTGSGGPAGRPAGLLLNSYLARRRAAATTQLPPPVQRKRVGDRLE
jgi:hypothetical protein